MIKFVVDTSSEYMLSEIKNKNIELVPVTINIAGECYRDSYDITKDEFYNLLTTNEEFPKTSQPSPEAFLNIFKEAKENSDTVICVLLSSELSGTCQSANIAKGMVDYDDIHIIDSLCATYMIKLLVDHACSMADNGATTTQIIDKIEELKSKATVCVALDTLEYLYKGGRLNKAAATIGEIANLKPVIDVIDGKVVVTKKCIGKNKSMSHILKTLEDTPANPDFPIYSIYTCNTHNCEKFEEKLTAKGYTFRSKEQVCSTIGAHVGTGDFGVIYITV